MKTIYKFHLDEEILGEKYVVHSRYTVSRTANISITYFPTVFFHTNRVHLTFLTKSQDTIIVTDSELSEFSAQGEASQIKTLYLT